MISVVRTRSGIICRAAQDGRGVGLLSSVALYTHNDQPDDPKDPFYTFPVKNNLPPYITWLVYRNDVPTPRFLQDFIRDTQAVFRTYARAMTKNYSVSP